MQSSSPLAHALPAVVAAGVLSALAGGTAYAQPRCVAPRVLLTVDKSSSMLGTLPAGGTKWDAARVAIGSVAADYEGRIDFGLQVFPFPDRCEPGRVTIDVANNPAATIVGGLGTPPPDAGNFTPMAQTLDVIAGYGPLRDAATDNHVIVVTDGWQWCSPYDPATRFTPVAAVERLHAAGITVHIVGFGAAVDSLTLNRAAVAAGTALPGCDPTLDDPAAVGHCYTQADDMVALRDALDDIARSITDEECDGLDNDCDGTIDEGFDEDGDGYRTCDGDCDDTRAMSYPGANESCNGFDDDCDGMADPSCDCTPGATQDCGRDVGACEIGTQTCGEDGAWGTCDGGVPPAEGETCDNVDEDCDGAVDDDATCPEGSTCLDGECVDWSMDPPPEMMMEPDPEDVPPPMEGGCACQAAGASADTGLLAPLAGLALLAVSMFVSGRRKRRP